MHRQTKDGALLFLLLNVIDNTNDSVRVRRPPVDHCVDTDRDAVAGEDLRYKTSSVNELIARLSCSVLAGLRDRLGLCVCLSILRRFWP